MTNRIILFGGTFDPVHHGHIRVADFAFEYIGASELVFVPAQLSPLKELPPSACGEDRLEMICLATALRKSFSVSDCELEKPLPGYTIDTVEYFQAVYGGGAEIYWLVGADAVGVLGKWHRIAELVDCCCLSVMYRAGFDRPDFGHLEKILGSRRIEKLNRHIIPGPIVDISSTQVRAALAGGGDAAGLLAPEVLAYIRRKGLYRA